MTNLTELLGRFIAEVRSLTGEPDAVVEIALHPTAMKWLRSEYTPDLTGATTTFMGASIVEKLPGETRPTRHYSQALPPSHTTE